MADALTYNTQYCVQLLNILYYIHSLRIKSPSCSKYELHLIIYWLAKYNTWHIWNSFFYATCNIVGVSPCMYGLNQQNITFPLYTKINLHLVRDTSDVVSVAYAAVRPLLSTWVFCVLWTSEQPWIFTHKIRFPSYPRWLFRGPKIYSLEPCEHI